MSDMSQGLFGVALLYKKRVFICQHLFSCGYEFLES